MRPGATAAAAVICAVLESNGRHFVFRFDSMLLYSFDFAWEGLLVGSKHDRAAAMWSQI